MAEATNSQMQSYCDTRLRPRMESARDLFERAEDDFSAIGEVFERAEGSNIWNDARIDGPPTLLASGGAADPDFIEQYNIFLIRLNQLKNGTFANVGEANQVSALYAVLVDACVRPL
jgi:hypothetical protein